MYLPRRSTTQAFCWGTSSLGALGSGGTFQSASPVPVQQGAVRFAELAASGSGCLVATRNRVDLSRAEQTVREYVAAR